MATASAATRTGRAVSRRAVAAGVTTSANSSSVPTTCTAIVMVSARRTTNAMPERPHRDAPGLGDRGVHRREHQRPGEDGEREHHDSDGERGEDQQLVVGDGQQVAEQHRRRRAGVRAGQRGEQHAERGGQRQDRAGGHLPVGHPPAEQADQQPAADAEDGQAEGDRDADEDRAGGAGEADVGQGVGGERVLPGDDEVAEQARRRRRPASRR